MKHHAMSVWPTGQCSPRTQLREAGCVPGTEFDRERIPPAVAAHVISRYTRVGDLVLDPGCGAGTVLSESLRSGRHAVGLTTDKQWWRLARSNITAAKTTGAWPDGSVFEARPKVLSTACAAGLVGRVGLVLCALRTRSDRDFARSVCSRLAMTLSHCRPLVRAGGHVVVVVHPRRHLDGALVDLGTQVTAAAASAGLTLVDRCIALTVELRDHRVVTYGSSRPGRPAASEASAGGSRLALNAHLAVLVFQLVRDVELAAASVSVPPRTWHDHAELVLGAAA